ncbi:phage protein NinX family protein [Enterobacter ludwigii]|uniref:phage protein NinX family protein n=1 Tax=Enterobacter ludwigii TaxID=299767 RepID=UPI003976FAB0
MDYSQLSDFEINRLVARAIDGLHGDDRTACDCYLSADIGSAIKIPDGDIGWITLDYCNNAADAWPIIVDNKINIRFGAEGMACEAQFIQYGHESVEFYHGNPLRAAMIVFLMMQDAKHA